MRVRPVPLLAAIFASAAAATAFVVSQLPREGETSPPPASVAADPVVPADVSPALVPAAAPGDGAVEVHVTAGGEPQPGADVRIYLAPGEAGAPWRRAGAARTGPDGVAVVPARAGTYLVAARAPGFAPGRAEVVRAPGEEVSRVDVALEPAASLHGRVGAPGGDPVASARARAIPHVSHWPRGGAPSVPPEELVEAVADASGTFRLEGLSPGAVAVSIDAPGHHPVLVPRVAVPGEPLAIVLEPLGALEGVVRSSDGRPVSGALVRVASPDHGATARTEADGTFRIAAPAGSYVLHAALGAAAGAAAAPVSIRAGATVRGAEVRLGPAAALRGAVVGPGGAPAAGAELALLVHDTGEVVARAVAARDGSFDVGGLPPGAYDARAAAPGASPALLGGVTLAAGARFPLRIALRGTGSAEGTVRDPAGRALAGVRVRAVPRGDGLAGAAPIEARTDFEGRFRLDGLAVGRAEIVALQDGVLAGVAQAIEVAEARVSPIDLVLPEAGLLAGRVRAEGRPPPPGTTVVATAMAGGAGALQIARVVTDASGNYALALPAGAYRVHAGPGDAAPGQLRATPSFARVEPRQTTALDLVSVAPARSAGVAILVLEPGGAPSPGAVVTLARAGDARVALATSAGEDGRAVVGDELGVAGRTVTIRARNGGRTGEETVTWPAEGTVAVRLAPGGAVAGVVRGAAGGGFTLEVSSQPAPGAWRTVDVHRFAGDRFELGDLPPDPLRLAVRSEDGRRGAAEIRVAPGERRTVEIALR